MFKQIHRLTKGTINLPSFIYRYLYTSVGLDGATLFWMMIQLWETSADVENLAEHCIMAWVDIDQVPDGLVQDTP